MEQNWFEQQESDPKQTSKSTTDCCSGAKIALQHETNRKQLFLKLDLQANKSEGVLGLSQDRRNPVTNSDIKLQSVCFQLQL